MTFSNTVSVVAGQMGQGAAQASDTLPHPDQSLEDCDGSGTTNADEVDAITRGRHEGHRCPPRGCGLRAAKTLAWHVNMG